MMSLVAQILRKVAPGDCKKKTRVSVLLSLLCGRNHWVLRGGVCASEIVVMYKGVHRFKLLIR